MSWNGGLRSLMVAACLLSLVGMVGCGTDEPTDKTINCTKNTDCDPGFYCGEDNKCAQDCDPGAEMTGCVRGETCSSLGRCVVDGECVIDDDCDSPPGEASCDGDTLVAFSQIGSCDLEAGLTVCNYSETRTACEHGCIAGQCELDPCGQTVCNNAPASVCDADGTTLVDYSDAGTCSEGVCDYMEVRSSCALGCSDGACQQGACDNTTCDTPPASVCEDETAIRYGDAGTCVDNGGAPFCDYMREYEDCLYTGSSCNNAQCENPLTEVGPIVIVEYMANPAGSFNDIGEWFEIVNTSAAAVDLDGWSLRSGGPGTSDEVHVIAGFGEIGPGERKVFVFSGSVPFAYDYNYDAVKLANNSDFLMLEKPGGAISDYVYYEPGSILSGRSRKLNPDIAPDANTNDLFANWCPSMGDEFAQSPSNYGTPGAANTACAVDPCADFVCEPPEGFCVDAENKAVQYVDNNTVCEASRLNNPFCDYDTAEVLCTMGTQLCAKGICENIPANVPAAGELIFTEFMGNPNGSDTDREWFEVYNTTGGPLALFSVIFSDNDTGGGNDAYQFLDINATVPASSYAVFARNTDPAVNGGVDGAMLYVGAHLKNNPEEATPFKLSLTRADGTVIDESYYDNPTTATSSLPSGRSIQLNPEALSAAGNDDAANWCFGATSYGEGGSGTPGAANEPCP